MEAVVAAAEAEAEAAASIKSVMEDLLDLYPRPFQMLRNFCAKTTMIDSTAKRKSDVWAVPSTSHTLDHLLSIGSGSTALLLLMEFRTFCSLATHLHILT